MKLPAIALACCLLPVAAVGQTPPNPSEPRPAAQQPAPPQRNPKATPEHERLRFLLGFWEEELDFSGAEPGPGRGRWTARAVLGMHVAMDYNSGGPQGPYRAHAVITWDKDLKAYRMWWLDDAGAIGEYKGNFTDDATLAFEHSGKVQGRDFRERITYVRTSPTEVRTKIEQAWDNGTWKPYLDAVAFRRGDRPPPPPNLPQGQQPVRPPL